MAKTLKDILSFDSTPRDLWYLIDCYTGDTNPLDGENDGDPVPVAPGSSWFLQFLDDQLYLTRSPDSSEPIIVSGTRVDAGGRLDKGDHSILVMGDPNYPRPIILSAGAHSEVWKNALSFSFKNGSGAGKGPFSSWDDLGRYVRGLNGGLSPKAFVDVANSDAFFMATEVWPNLETSKTRQTTEIPQVTVVSPKEQFGSIEEPEEETEETEAPEEEMPEISGDTAGTKEFFRKIYLEQQGKRTDPDRNLDHTRGKLICLYERSRFDEDQMHYFPAHKDLRRDPPFRPTEWDNDFNPLDSKGVPCTRKACPHCHRPLPGDFGEDYRYHIVSLVGQSGSGKSYYLGAMVKRLAKPLKRMGIAAGDDDAHMNRPLRELSRIPFKAGEPWKRYIDKTDEDQATQITVETTRKGAVSVPRPFSLRLVERKTKVVSRLVFYDNNGEHFTQFDYATEKAAQADAAAGHLSHASFTMVLYDPLLNETFCGALGREPLFKHDDQLQMLQKMDELMNHLLDRKTRERNRQKPLAVLVGKWDAWEELAPNLERDYLDGNGHLDTAVIEKNSEILSELLLDYDTGIPGAAEVISDNVTYFPVSGLGQVPIKVRHTDLGVDVWVPETPAEPWCVEVPVLWGLTQLESTTADELD